MTLHPSFKVFITSMICCFITPLAHASDSLESMILNDSWPEAKQRPHVVFNIDNTLCKPIDGGKDFRFEIHKSSPEAILIPFCYENKEHKLSTHVFFQGIGELFLTIFNWGWNMDIFSSGSAYSDGSCGKNIFNLNNN